MSDEQGRSGSRDPAGAARPDESERDETVLVGADDREFEGEFDDLDPDSDVEAFTAEALRRFGLELEDFAEPDDESDVVLPVVAVVGRPNVGKSTLVNRIIGRREAVVEDVPGVTRDRVSYEAHWGGREFLLVDTGGWDQRARGMAALVAAQAERAMVEADVVMLVVDATVGATDADDEVVKVLRRGGKPVVLVANKVDDDRGEADAALLWSLGLGEPYPVSATHGRGSGDMLDAIVAVLPEVGSGLAPQRGPRRVALLGKPNVGKSSLLNKVAGDQRVVVDSVAGTTVDPVDELVEIAGVPWRFVDTAGIRKRVHEASGHEYYASLRTRAALEKAEVAVVLLEANEVLAEQDLRILTMVVETGRALVIAYNKWDLVDEERRHYLERENERDLTFVRWAPRVNVSARTGRHMDKLVPALDAALAGWDTRVPTGRLNQFMADLVAAHPHPVRGGKQPRMLFATQASTRPPTFVLFTRASWRPATGASSSGACARSSASWAARSRISVRVREKRGRNARRT